MKALSKVNFPVPKVLVLCEDESVIGQPFFVMELVKGRIFRDTTLPGTFTRVVCVKRSNRNDNKREEGHLRRTHLCTRKTSLCKLQRTRAGKLWKTRKLLLETGMQILHHVSHICLRR